MTTNSIVNHPAVEVGTGVGLLSIPYWSTVLQDVYLGASIVAALCGAIIGIHGVWRIWKSWKESRRVKHDLET
jgi:uncharacterized protein (DUF2062 family)